VLAGTMHPAGNTVWLVLDLATPEGCNAKLTKLVCSYIAGSTLSHATNVATTTLNHHATT